MKGFSLWSAVSAGFMEMIFIRIIMVLFAKQLDQNYGVIEFTRIKDAVILSGFCLLIRYNDLER